MAKKKQETKNNKKEKKEVVVKEEKVVKEVPKKESKKESKKDTKKVNKVNDDSGSYSSCEWRFCFDIQCCQILKNKLLILTLNYYCLMLGAYFAIPQ